MLIGGPTSWPPRTSDITPLHFFVGISQEHCVPKDGKHHREATADL
jgi:hypothetical protein